MNVNDIATQMVFMQSSAYAAAAGSNSALAPAVANPFATTSSSSTPATTPTSALLTSYNAVGASTVYGLAGVVGTLFNGVA